MGEAALKKGGHSKEGKAALDKFLKKQPKNAKLWPKCSHVIAICMKRVATDEGRVMPEWEEISAIACAVQNAHLVARKLGVAAYWSSGGGFEGPLATPEMRALLGLEDGDKCLGVMCVGRADATSWKNAQDRASRGPMSEKTRWL